MKNQTLLILAALAAAYYFLSGKKEAATTTGGTVAAYPLTYRPSAGNNVNQAVRPPYAVNSAQQAQQAVKTASGAAIDIGPVLKAGVDGVSWVFNRLFNQPPSASELPDGSDWTVPDAPAVATAEEIQGVFLDYPAPEYNPKDYAPTFNPDT